MKRPRWLTNPFKRRKPAPVTPIAPLPKPLREFVYLDEVSLRSLLSSQTGEVTDVKSEHQENALQAEIGSAIGTNVPLAVKSEITSRFQTSNSSTLQTSRKATVQSWFGELHACEGLRLIETRQSVDAVSTRDELEKITDPSLLANSSDLVRGNLVEFRVQLSADPVFRLGTMVSEFTGMAEDFPAMFAEANALQGLNDAIPVNKILQRLLAGLIPVRAQAVDHVAITIDDAEYVVHRNLLNGLNIQQTPLEIVGVTEHLAYWKDIRRVLFSDAEFTVLGRISRSGLHPSWTPVKLVDLFSELTPDLVEQISSASLIPFDGSRRTSSINPSDKQLAVALGHYKDALLHHAGKKLSAKQTTEVDERIEALQSHSASASLQRDAFAALRSFLTKCVQFEIDAATDLKFRESARQQSSLPFFPSLSGNQSAPNPTFRDQPEGAPARLLDLEIIAIYW